MSHKSYLVLGGAGFLGSHIVDALKERGETSISVFDIAEDHKSDGVKYYVGDIMDEDRLTDVLKETGANIVLHTVSPVHGLPAPVYQRVNVDGTRAVLSACRKTNVTSLIYTSSTGVVWTGQDFNGVTEAEAEIPAKGYDAYHHTKAIGERLVLAQNDTNGMRTVVLRPCGMFGERDKQMIWRLAKSLQDGQQNVQIGDNKNIIDYLYVGNAARAHVLAADRLTEKPELVAGQAFFITNGSPTPHWTFARAVWKELGDDGKKKIIKIPRAVALLMAYVAELWSALTGRSVELTTFNIRFITGTQWYNIKKAQNILDYEPQITVEEGIRRTTKWWKEIGSLEYQRRSKKVD